MRKQRLWEGAGLAGCTGAGSWSSGSPGLASTYPMLQPREEVWHRPPPRASVRPSAWLSQRPEVRVSVQVCQKLVSATRTPERSGGVCQTNLKGLLGWRHISTRQGDPCLSAAFTRVLKCRETPEPPCLGKSHFSARPGRGGGASAAMCNENAAPSPRSHSGYSLSAELTPLLRSPPGHNQVLQN